MDEVMDIEMKLELAGKMSGEIWEKIMCLIITRRNSMRALFTTYYLCHSCLCFCVLYFFLVKSYECIVSNWIFRIRLCYCSCRVWVCMVGRKDRVRRNQIEWHMMGLARVPRK